MKKILLFTGAALAFAACTNEELINDATSKLNKGITFEMQYPESMVETRGALTAERNFFWFAEQDRVNIYGYNVNGPAVAQYKATISGANGQFTSIDDANMLTFKGTGANYKSDFIATYPTSTVVVSKVTNTGNDITSAVITTESNSEQELNFNEVKAPMLGISNNQYRDENWQSVGEKAKMNLNRIYPVIKLASAANNKKYYDDYLGKLQTVTITADAVIADADKADYEFAESIADAGTTTYDSKDGKITKASATNTIIVDIEDAKWNSEDYINVSILPVKAEIVKKTDNKVKKVAPLKFTITYDFEDVTLVKTITQTTATDLVWSNGTDNNLVYTLPALDIANDFKYIVTKTNKLLVFSDSFGAIYTDNNKNTIKWGSNPVNPAVNAITAIYSEVVLADAEQANIQKFTSATGIELTAQTSIVKDAFKNLGGIITDLKLPKVTSYADAHVFSILKNLDLGSYTFTINDQDVAKQFFNTDTKETLETLDIHSVTSLSPVFGFERNILFTDYAALKTIKLNAEGTTISANEFKGCVKLEKVEGVVKMGTAASAFEGASVSASTQPTINMSGTVIPANAFKGTKIKNIKYNGATIVPTAVGASAFENNTAIEALDLKSATTIGANAFKGATAFKGIGKNGVVTLNVATVEADAFNGTIVARFQLKEATTVKAGALNATGLKQVKFRKNVRAWNSTNSTGINTGFIADPSNVDLFIKSAADQAAFGSLVFRTVTEDDTDWQD